MSTPYISGPADNGQLANSLNGVMRDVDAMKKVQIFKDDTGTRRVLMGRGPDGFYGLKVSQEGSDVYEAGDDELVFNSDQNVFKIIATGTDTFPSMAVAPAAGDATSGSLTINTGIATTTPLAYFVFGRSSVSDNYYPFPVQAIVFGAGASGVYGGYIGRHWDSYGTIIAGTWRIVVSGSNFVNVVAQPLYIRWYVLQETILNG